MKYFVSRFGFERLDKPNVIFDVLEYVDTKQAVKIRIFFQPSSLWAFGAGSTPCREPGDAMFSVIKAYLSHRVGCTRHNRTFLHCRHDRRRSQLCDEWLWWTDIGVAAF
jgi:hypothetical protein